MGLAPYGNLNSVDAILNELVDLKEDGSYKIEHGKYFTFVLSTMTIWKK